jgi:hypothetical protein
MLFVTGINIFFPKLPCYSVIGPAVLTLPFFRPELSKKPGGCQGKKYVWELFTGRICTCP